jgi:hypothetical protein
MGDTPTGSFDSLDALLAASTASDTAATPAPPADQPPPPATITTQTPALAAQIGAAFNVTQIGQLISPNDAVQLSCWNSNTTLTSVSAFFRVLKPDGTIVIQQITISNLTADRTLNTALIQQLEGFLIGIVLEPPAVPVFRGQCFVAVDLLTGSPGAFNTTLRLMADYLSSGDLPAWPDDEIRGPTDGHGFIALYRGAAPIKGATASLVQPPGVRWRIIAVQCGITASAAALNRNPLLFLFQKDSTGTLRAAFDGPTSAVVTAGQTANMCWAPSVAPESSTGPLGPNMVAGMPEDFVMSNQGQVNVSVTPIDANDQLAVVQAQVEEWIDL